MTFSPGCCCFVPPDVPKPDPCGVQVYGCFPGWPDKEPPGTVNCHLTLPQFSLNFEHPCGGGVMTSPGSVDITLVGGATGYGTTGYAEEFGGGGCQAFPLHFGANNDGETISGGNYDWTTSHLNSSWGYSSGHQKYESEEISWRSYRGCQSADEFCPQGCSPGGFCGVDLTGKLVTTVKVTLACKTTTEAWGDPGNPLEGVPFLRPGTSGGPNDPPVQDWVFPDDFVKCRGICRDSDGTGDNYYGCFPGNPTIGTPNGFDVSIENTLLNSLTCAYKMPNDDCDAEYQGCDIGFDPAYYDVLNYADPSVQICPTPNYPVWTRGSAKTLPDAYGDTCRVADKPDPGGFPESWTHAYWYDDPNIPPKVATQGSDVSEMPCYTTIGRVEIECNFDQSNDASFLVGRRTYDTLWEGCPLESGEMFPSGDGDHQVKREVIHRYKCEAGETSWEGLECGAMKYWQGSDSVPPAHCHAICNDHRGPDRPPPSDGTPDVTDTFGNPIDSCPQTGFGGVWTEPGCDCLTCPGLAPFNFLTPATPPYNFTTPGWARKGMSTGGLASDWTTQQFFKDQGHTQGIGHHFLLQDGPPPHEYMPVFPMECGVTTYPDPHYTWPYQRCVCVGCGVDGCFQSKTYAAPGTELASDVPCEGSGTCYGGLGPCPCDNMNPDLPDCAGFGCACGGCCCYVYGNEPSGGHGWPCAFRHSEYAGPFLRDTGNGRWLLTEPGIEEAPVWNIE